MKIKNKLGFSTFSIDEISILLLIIFCFNVCWLKTAYYFESPTIWNNLYKWCQHILFIYIVMLFFFHIRCKKKIYFVPIILLINILLVYEMVISKYNNNLFYFYTIEQIAIWPMCFIVGFLYCDKLIAKRYVTNITIVIYCLLSIPSIISHLSGRGNIGGVIFPVYILIAMGSFLLIEENSVLKTSLIFFIGIIILCTTKRTGLLCIILGLLTYYLLDIFFKNKPIKGFIKIILLIICLALVGTWAINHFNLDILDRFSELQSDGGSGRNEIWQQVYLAFQASNFEFKLLGHGFQAISYNLNIQGRGIMAHNDYLEYLYDYGIIGVCLVACFLIAILKRFFLLIKKRSSLTPAFAYVIVCFTLLSTFSYLMDESRLINLFALFLGMTFSKEITSSHLLAPRGKNHSHQLNSNFGRKLPQKGDSHLSKK